MNHDLSTARMTLQPALARRVLACGLTVSLGLLVWGIAATEPDASAAGRALMVGLGALALWLAVELWRGTARGIELIDGVLQDTQGREIARVSEIAGLERGVFAIKPSQGMVLRLRTPGPVAWVPGLWWRLGRRVGIGGMTPKAQTKALAETLEALIGADGFRFPDRQ